MAVGEPRFDLVIFDNDGVVVDSEPLASLAMSETLAGLGYQMTTEQIDDQLKGGTLARTRSVLEARFGALPADFEDAYTGRLYRLMTERLRPVPGVEAVLDALDQAGVPYCLASSGRRERVLFALRTAGLAHRFDKRYWGAEDVAMGKPAPDLFLLAASRMGTSPGRCAVVEDSDLGVEAAKTAGMSVFGFAARTPPERLAGADAVFKHMADLPPLLLAPSVEQPVRGRVASRDGEQPAVRKEHPQPLRPRVGR
jgi:HAD superfamily hydrolase (TIGR01509 family)